ncbi:MAG: hypothetical protein RL750_740, partial [Bacteroidota bacterium]
MHESSTTINGLLVDIPGERMYPAQVEIEGRTIKHI